MPRFSQRSLDRLATCHPRLQRLMERVIVEADCTVLVGHRSRDDQEAAFRTGRSKLRWPQSKHNRLPSAAVDVAPYPIDWQDRERFHHFAGLVRGIAAAEGIALRWGGDWDGDYSLTDNRFDDLVHFELMGD